MEKTFVLSCVWFFFLKAEAKTGKITTVRQCASGFR